MLAPEWVSLLMGCVQYIQGVHVFIFITNNSLLMRSFLLMFAVCSGVSVFDTSVRCICNKPSPKSCLADADSFSKLSVALLVILHEPGERDELVPVPPVPEGTTRRWTRWAGGLPEPLFAGMRMSKAAAQLVSQPVAWHLWKCWHFRKLCQPLLTSREIEMQSQKDTNVPLPYFN